jgi:hypothetical protein
MGEAAFAASGTSHPFVWFVWFVVRKGGFAAGDAPGTQRRFNG